MSAKSLTLLMGAIAALAFSVSQTYTAEPTRAPKVTDKVSPKKATDWKNDPVCQMVFFAVLEGLYTDGVPDEVVDSIVPRKKDGDNPLKTSFVVQCPLCHPVYEAFSQYQRRQAFNGDEGKRDTFGRGIDPTLIPKLKSTDPKTRLTALRVLVRQWVERRLTLMRLTKEEKRDWIDKLGKRSQQGRKLLNELLLNDPRYKGWSGYWGCAACNGTNDACHTLNLGVKKE